ncbi:DUF4443 domain-containing protein [Thermococcus paralvinellae]|uniref:DUF4443 domain-containing protein n=1 Tax=Thermococcus paralvinellae TaxID=582419 RepID=W0I3T1_9EURY|nr:DUF4443 domain-containing protein [Thermococcus paralvinellae]AHF80699.1 Hypothetical protein TES1_1319 [Thermococcus paralvinellae]
MGWKRGAYPEFTLEDAVATLFLLKTPRGRKQISEELDLGEGSVRTLLKKLSKMGLIESKQKGHYLNEKGLKVLSEITTLFSEPVEVEKVENMPTYALLVKNPPQFKSIELRDEAIRYFARGAMILVCRNGEIVFPEDGRSLKETLPKLAEDLKKLNPEEGDLIVVTWAEDKADAIKSAIHVALTLKKSELPKEILEVGE